MRHKFYLKLIIITPSRRTVKIIDLLYIIFLSPLNSCLLGPCILSSTLFSGIQPNEEAISQHQSTTNYSKIYFK